jgi:enediyne biosynthesis protein E4
LVLADLDGDGKLDVIISNMDSAPAILRNVTDTKNHWLAIKLVGDISQKTPKDAIGTKVFVTTGKLRQRFDVTSGAGYASQSDQIIHVGLGEVTKVDKLEIVWANNQIETVPVNRIDAQIVIRQNERK